MTVFLLPFAGGNKYVYRELQRHASDGVSLITLEYPGRGGRSCEEATKDLNSLSTDILQQIARFDPTPEYVIYGHSMGALIGWQVCRKIMRTEIQPPVRLIVSGMAGPSTLAWQKKQRYKLGKQKLLSEVKALHDDPSMIEVLENEDFFDFVEPIIRADFQATETFEYERSEMLTLPITVMTGTNEAWTPDEVLTWRNETTNTVKFLSLPGRHFFIFQHSKTVYDTITSEES